MLYDTLARHCSEYAGPGVRLFLAEEPRTSSGLGALDAGILVVPERVDFGSSIDRHYGYINIYTPDPGTGWEEGLAIAGLLRQDPAMQLLSLQRQWGKQAELWLTVLRTSMIARAILGTQTD